MKTVNKLLLIANILFPAFEIAALLIFNYSLLVKDDDPSLVLTIFVNVAVFIPLLL